ncbi:MAG: Type 1 glutamine amidotransferase-like domain-containing protein [Pseudomonadota bacterium]
MSGARRLLLGPQRPTINLDAAMERANLGADDVAVISAAWQEAEGDIDDVRALTRCPLFDLQIYRRAEALFLSDDALREAHSIRQRRLKQQQSLYRLRLKQLTLAAREILTANGDADAIAEERRHAISQLRALDRHHVRQMDKIHAEFNEQFNVDSYAELRRYVDAIREDLARCSGVLITGGNVMVLLNRLQLFGMGSLLHDKPLIAWSAGAMVLTERIVLYHDRMPQGRREPEIISRGLGVLPEIVLLPDARNRLDTGRAAHIGLFSRRFSPAVCLTLDSGSLIQVEDGRYTDSIAVNTFSRDGNLSPVNALAKRA